MKKIPPGNWAPRICRGTARRRAVQIRRTRAKGGWKRLGFPVVLVGFGDSGWSSAVLNGKLKLQCQLAIVQAGQGWRSLERFIQPGLQIAVNKELLAQQGDQIR